jgi:hypothetical protein
MSWGVYDHYRPIDDSLDDGVYRVVGGDASRVTLLRVGDAEGRRVTTGSVTRIDADRLAGFESVSNPDGNRPLAARLASLPATVYWSGRTFGGQLAAHPVPTVVALAVVLIGLVDDRVVTVPDTVSGLLILAGSLGLAYVGGGRLD